MIPLQPGIVDRQPLPAAAPALRIPAAHRPCPGWAGRLRVHPAGLPALGGPVTTSALTAANLAIIPIQCEYYSLQALATMFKTSTMCAPHQSRAIFPPAGGDVRPRGSLHTRALELLRGRYAGALFETVIGFDFKLRESQLAGIPIPLFCHPLAGTQQYQTLARELYAYVEKQTLPELA